jgi:uncharacterized protein (DUF169 family)
MTSDLLSSLTPLKLEHAPVAIGFLDAPPAGFLRVERPAAAGCAYWKDASDGHAFYTTADDHQNCPVGAFTHAVDLPPAKAQELESLVGTMIQLQYLSSDEIPRLPRRATPMRIAAYAPLGRGGFEPDVIIFRGTPRQIMLLAEAARAAGIFDAGTTLGRPACAVIPQAIGAAAGVASIGCVGNRVYTELGDDELYLAVPGRALTEMLEKLGTILHANSELETFHRQRAAALA